MFQNYLIIGDDEYLREAETNKIKEKFLTAEETNLNYSVHSYSDINGIMDSLGTLPFLAKKRVALIKEAHQLSNESVETLILYLQKPPETSVLVLSSDASLKNTQNYTKLSNLVNVVKLDKPSPEKLRAWMRAFLKKEGIEILPQAVDLIVELKGTDTGVIRMELEKLILFSSKKPITVGHVEELVGRNVKETIFKLVDAINAKDKTWAFRIIKDLYSEKKEPHEIIGYLAWYIRIMQKITLLSSKGIKQNAMARELGYSIGYTERLTAQAKKYSISRIEKWLSLLLEADKDIKRGKKSAPLALEILLISLVW